MIDGCAYFNKGQAFVEKTLNKEVVFSCQEIQYKGYLSKLSPKSMVGWQKRYFVLFQHKLKYWKNLNEFMHKKHPKGILDFTKA